MRISLLARTAVVVTLGATTLVGASTPAFAATKRPTTLSIHAAKATIVKGHRDEITGVLLSGRTPEAKKKVELEGRVPGHPYKVLSQHMTGSKGKVNFDVKPPKTKQFKLVFAGTSTLKASQSSAVTVKVTK
jgi:hypothetical protein